MPTDILTGMVVVIAVAVLLVIKVWGYKLLKFKMDESAIISFLEASKDGSGLHSTEAIATATNISAGRVSNICAGSNSILPAGQTEDSWCLKR